MSEGLVEVVNNQQASKVSSDNCNSSSVLELLEVSHSYVQGNNRLNVLKNVDLTINKAEMVALVAPSGSGKSTLLHIAGLLEKPDAGEVAISGCKTGNLKSNIRTRLRRHEIGFVYQFHHLLPEFSAMENIIIPQLIAGVPRSKSKVRATKLLEHMELAERITHKPSQLSGGEQQRVAIARAIANSPSLLLADEPTGNLDSTTAKSVFNTLYDIVNISGLGALIATHNHDLAKQMDRCITIADGKITELKL